MAESSGEGVREVLTRSYRDNVACGRENQKEEEEDLPRSLLMSMSMKIELKEVVDAKTTVCGW